VRNLPGQLLCATISVGLFLLPAGIWTFVAGFHPTLAEFLGLIFTFSIAPFYALLNPRLPDWLADSPGYYLLNLIPALIIGLAAYLILRKLTKLSPLKTACIAGNASLLLLQGLGSLMLYFFARYSGP